MIIGIAGGSGSGKTTLTKQIQEVYDALVISLDDYYLDQSDISLKERNRINYDTPNQIEMDLLIQHIQDLKEGKSIQMPIYDFSIHNRVGYKEVKPSKLIIVEGLFTLQNQRLRDLLDLKIFVDCDEKTRFERRVKRDQTQRNRNLFSIEAQFRQCVKPMHELYVEPTKKQADLIVPGDFTDIECIKERIEMNL